MSYHRAVSKTGEWKAGDVIRMFKGPFGDAIVLGFNEDDYALVERPYAYVSLPGSSCPTVLLGSERIEYLNLNHNFYTRIDRGRTV